MNDSCTYIYVSFRPMNTYKHKLTKYNWGEEAGATRKELGEDEVGGCELY